MYTHGQQKMMNLLQWIPLYGIYYSPKLMKNPKTRQYSHIERWPVLAGTYQGVAVIGFLLKVFSCLY